MHCNGDIMNAIKIINYIIMVIFFSCYSYQFLFIPISLLAKKKKHGNVKFHRYAVLIAARNEETVIGNLIDSLNLQDYPKEMITIYVVADNCTDNTAEIAKLHGAVVFERSDQTNMGKGYAINYLLRKITEFPAKRPDAYIVFDADNIVDKNYISEINKTFSEGYEIVTSYRNSKNYGDNWISAGYGLWFLREARYLNQPRSVIGSSCGVSGTGFLFSDYILQKCGGWNFFLLTEDIEFTANNIVSGEKIGYCPTAVFYDEQPTSFRQSIRQRMRWAKGYLQVLRKYGRSLLKACFHGSFSCFDMLMNIAPAAVLAWTSILINLAAVILSFYGGTDLLTVGMSIGQSILNLYLTVFALGLITTLSEWKKIRCTAAKKLLYTFTFPIFMMTYIPISIAALFCRPSWKPIEHTKNVSIDEFCSEYVKERSNDKSTSSYYAQ